jgi:hypothetical protein
MPAHHREPPQDSTGPCKNPLAEIREALFDELDRLRAGTSTPAQANAVARSARAQMRLIKAAVKVPRAGARRRR